VKLKVLTRSQVTLDSALVVVSEEGP